MAELPKIGLHHSDGLAKAKRFAKMPFRADQKCNLVNSVINQVKLAEGEKSANSIKNEVTHSMKSHNWHDNPKARPQGFIVSICFKDCQFQGTNVCDDCIGSDKFQAIDKEDNYVVCKLPTRSRTRNARRQVTR